MNIPLEEVVKRLNDEDWHVRYAACTAFPFEKLLEKEIKK